MNSDLVKKKFEKYF